MAVTYDMAMRTATVKLVYANVKFDGATATSATNEGREIGVEYSSGFGRIYVNPTKRTTTPAARLQRQMTKKEQPLVVCTT